MGKKKKGCKIVVMLAVIGLLSMVGCGGDQIMNTNVGDRLPDNHQEITESCGSSTETNNCHGEGVI